MIVVVVRADEAESVDRFLRESHFDQFNVADVIPSLPLEEGLGEIQSAAPIF
ncbi:hypothetical protein O1L60_21835 [Streptomyces diastatochromogenes]|nr:hypothetical protein [Streptomyces diastatochromogenes]